MSIRIFTTGGTIDKMYFDAKSAYQVGEPQIDRVLKDALVTADYRITPLLQKDSLDLTDEDRQRVVREVHACPETKIIVTHGTDTMIETARALAAVPAKTIVLTGSLAPARFRDSDAFFNIGSAFAAVQILPPGVYLTMNGRIFDPFTSRKNVAENRFEEDEGSS